MSSISVDLAESRYDRQERIKWWDQDRLRSSRVLVVGAGALGNEIVKNLALIGVGSILVVDFDTVDRSNFSRCVFFRDGDEGSPKAALVAERAQDLNPHVEVVGWSADVRSIGAGFASRADVLVGALDSREARLALNRLAWRAQLSWIDGAIEGLQGIARCFHPPTSCYECTLSERDFEILAHRQSCRLLSLDEIESGKAPTTATTASLVGAIEAQEVVKVLHAASGGSRPLDGALVFDGDNNDSYPLSYDRNPDCFAHDEYRVDVTIDASGHETFSEIVRAAGFDRGRVEMGADLLTGWKCTTCVERMNDFAGPVSMASSSDATCQACGLVRQPVTITRVEVPGELADLTWAAVGLPLDEIVAVQGDESRRFVWLRAAPSDLPVHWTCE